MSISDIFKINQFKQQIQELTDTVASITSQLENTKRELSLSETKASQLSVKLYDRDKFIKSHLPIFEFNRFDFSSDLQEVWNSAWAAKLHQLPPQLERQHRACSSRYTPLNLSPDNSSGRFRGLENDYCTTLVKCDCVDFQRRALPCKHMYRLAHEFDVFMLEDVEHDSNVSRLMHLSQFKQLLERIPSECRDILSYLKNNHVAVVSRADITPLIYAELIVISEDKSVLLDSYKRDELYNLLPEDASVRKNAKKSVLIEYIIANCPDVIDNLEKLTVAIQLSPSIEYFIYYI